MTTKKAFVNANIITMNPAAPTADAIGIAGDTISLVGSRAEVEQWANADTEVVDVQGKTIIPGLIESHNHISIGAAWAKNANCSSVTCRNIEHVLNAVAEAAANKAPGEWVQGFGYDDTGIEEMRHLTRHDLDAVTSEHPVFINHVSGHLAYLNSAALAQCGITGATPDPAGGTIHKDERGEPSGLLLENAAFAARVHLPEPSREELKQLLVQKIADFNALGLTSTHDAALGLMGDASDVLSVCRELEREKALNIRIYTAVLDAAYNKYDALGVAKGYGSHYFKIGGVKFFQDGSIQGFTGALLDAYHTKPENWGQLIYPQEVLNEKIAYHHRNGDHIVIHGNGDAAIESILQAFEAAQAAHPREDHRHMLIHCQMAHQNHIERMQRLGIIPSYFINHIYYWGDRHAAIFVGPERAARMNPLGSSLRHGLLFSVHSDYPITPVDPMFTMHTAVNRLTRSGQVLGPEERISPLQALKTFTTAAAMCSFEEDVKGSLEAGKLADLVVLSDDILSVPHEQIKDIKVLRTVVGGKTVYQRVSSNQ